MRLLQNDLEPFWRRYSIILHLISNHYKIACSFRCQSFSAPQATEHNFHNEIRKLIWNA